MKIISIALFTIFSFSSFATESFNTQFSNALDKAGVEKTGHRDYQEAHIVCQISNCDVENKNFFPTTTKHLDGKLAKKISSLLSQAGITPTGLLDYQEAYVICRIPKISVDGESLCDVERVNAGLE